MLNKYRLTAGVSQPYAPIYRSVEESQGFSQKNTIPLLRGKPKQWLEIFFENTGRQMECNEMQTLTFV